MPVKIEATGLRRGQKQLLDAIREIQAKFGPRVLTTRVVKAAVDDYVVLDVEPALQRNLAGDLLKRRTGSLASRTRVTSPTVKGSEVSFEIQTNNIPYGLIHEVGGTIVPRTAKALTIPLPDALTPAGVLRKTAAEYRQNPSPFDGTFAAKGVIFGKRPNSDAIVPLFAFAKKVEIPARHWASSAIDDTVDSLIARIEAALDRHLAGRGPTA